MLLASMLAAFGLGFVGNIATNLGIAGWYQVAQRPDFAPPVGLFVPLATILHGLLGWAAYRLWLSPASSRRSWSLLFLAFLLVLSAVWPWAFFVSNKLLNAFAIACAMGLAGIGSMVAAPKTDKTVPLLIAPFWMWSLCLVALSFTMWRLNPNVGVAPEAVPPPISANKR